MYILYSVIWHITLYRTMPIFNDSGKQAFLKHSGKRRNCCYTAFLLFPQYFLPYPRKISPFELH